MFRRVSTEVQGWREALASPEIQRALGWRVLVAALSSAAGAVGSLYTAPVFVVLWVTGSVLLGSLALLRLRGHP